MLYLHVPPVPLWRTGSTRTAGAGHTDMSCADTFVYVLDYVLPIEQDNPLDDTNLKTESSSIFSLSLGIRAEIFFNFNSSGHSPTPRHPGILPHAPNHHPPPPKCTSHSSSSPLPLVHMH